MFANSLIYLHFCWDLDNVYITQMTNENGTHTFKMKWAIRLLQNYSFFGNKCVHCSSLFLTPNNWSSTKIEDEVKKIAFCNLWIFELFDLPCDMYEMKFTVNELNANEQFCKNIFQTKPTNYYIMKLKKSM